jgi:formylglycine-generating enzyme required for sulfatase activity
MLHLRPVLAALLFAAPANAVTIDWVTVGDPGVAADTTGFGFVATEYRISATEVSNAQYAEFLNAVAGSDPNGLYNPNMGSSAHGGITQTCTTGCSYATKTGMDDRPVNFVSFWDALRFANWLHNGQTTNAASTESGAYTLTPTGIADNTVTRNAGASIFLTSEDEWYKAAYSDGSGGWFDYPVGSDTQTLCSALTGVPNSGNCANAVGTVTAVGAYVLSSSATGTFDQAGNVVEWTEAIIGGSTRNIRGGDWFSNPANQAAAFRTSSSPTVEISTLGFRVASPIPEPGTGLLVAAGLAGLAARRRSS